MTNYVIILIHYYERKTSAYSLKFYMIKLIASDMDGTFLNSKHEVPEKNKELLNLTNKNNIDFIVATGRAHYEALPALQDANINCDLICFNGGITYDKNGKLLDIVPIETKNLYFAIEVFKSLDLSYQLYTKNTVYTNSIETDIQAYKDLIENTGAIADVEKLREDCLRRIEKGHLTEVDNIELHINDEQNPAIKVIAISSEPEKLKKAYELLEPHIDIAVTSSGSNNLEIMDKNATKGKALKKYAKLKNISLENTAAFGDNLNDISMLAEVGYGVAMKNGSELTKKTASLVTEKTNDESGVYYTAKFLIEDNINKTLIEKAIEATKFSYVPYSNFRVGAALLCETGKIYSGCNIENASYTPTNCAERTAIFKAVSEGETKFTKIAIVGGIDGNITQYCPPCGVCRQVISEFADENFEIILASSPDDYKVYNFFSEILPLSFSSKDLDK